MNQERKNALAQIAVKIDALNTDLQIILDSEEEARENMKDETAVERSETASEAISNAIESLQSAEQELEGIE